jgi:hypothetical protein
MDFEPALSQKEIRSSTKRFIFTTTRRSRRRVPHLSDYFEFYDNERPHEALGYRTTHEVYFGTKARLAPASEAMI